MTIEKLTEEVQADLLSIIALVDDELGEPPMPRPKGFGITAKEYATAKGCSEDYARKMLNKMVELGKFDKKPMVDGRGTTPLVYYQKESE